MQQPQFWQKPIEMILCMIFTKNTQTIIGSKTKVIPLSVEKFQVMVDSDGDNTFETINEYHWSQFTDFIITWKIYKSI